MSKGRSGIRITSAPPARPEWSAIQPAWRPITSTIITRLCDSAVVCRRSIASVAICTAVSKPNVMSVPPRSLSIVFGTPSTGRPCSPWSRAAAPSVSSPPIAISPFRLSVCHVLADPLGPVVALEGVRARRAQDRAAARQDAARRLDRQLLVGVLDRTAPAVAEADDRVAVAVDAAPHDRADDRVQTGAVAPSGEHADPHAGVASNHTSDSACRWSARHRLAAACSPLGGLPGRATAPARARHACAGDTATRLPEPARARRLGARGARRRGRRAARARGRRRARRRAADPAAHAVRDRGREPGEQAWDPGLVSANADRAADDPKAIAYLGELAYGARRSRCPSRTPPTCCRCRPTDGLTSLTQHPARPAALGARAPAAERRAQLRAARPERPAARPRCCSS